MSLLRELELAPFEGLRIEITGSNEVRFSGMITVFNSHDTLLPSFRAIHEAALADGISELTADVRALTFVNSSAIRLFIDWSTWLRNHEESSRYLLRFTTDKSVTWQRTSFLALKSLVPGIIEVQS